MHYKKIQKGWFDYQNLYLDIVLNAPPGSTVIELGTFAGKSFAYLLEAAVLKDKPLKLYSVDSYVGAGGISTTYDEAAWNVRHVEQMLSKTHAVKWLRWVAAGGHWQLLKADSLKLDVSSFQNVYAVFCDTDHEYETISAELAKYYKIIMPGGMLAGHDFNPANAYDFPGVQKAVFEFAETEGLGIIQYPPRSFAFKKPDGLSIKKKKG